MSGSILRAKSGRVASAQISLVLGLTLLLARAVFVLDKQGVIQYVELVKEVASEPNYTAALNAAKKLL